MTLATLITLATLTLSALTAADVPLGQVEKVEGERTWLRFSANPPRPGTVVAIYGQPAVERHPLTGEVIISRPVLIAKVQVIGVTGLVETRTVWRGPTAVAVGQDAVPLPHEAAPDAPPGPTAALPAISGAVGQPIDITLPIADPDRQAVTYRWSLSGAPGRAGVLEAQTTRVPTLRWWAPGQPGNAKLLVTARDSQGQEWSGAVELTAAAGAASANPSAAAQWGTEREPGLTRLTRLGDGRWLGITTDRRMVRLTPGWNALEVVAAGVREPVAMAARGSDLAVIDGRGVVILGPDLGVKAKLEGLSAPTDVAATAEAWLVADARLGGIAVIEADGRFRCLLGRSGEGADDFKQLTRVAVSDDGTIIALDSGTRTIHRFDRFLKRLPSWALPKEAGQPVDVASAASRLVVLADDGRVTVLDEQGRPSASGTAHPAVFGVIPRGTASDVIVEGDQVLVCWPSSGLISRAGIAGIPTGVRGATIRPFTLGGIDGNGTVWSFDEDRKAVVLTDYEGWRIASLPIPEKVRTVKAVVPTPDGTAVLVLDSRNRTVVRIPRDSPTTTVNFAGQGKNPGQLVAAAAMAIDEAGRCYVLDDDQCKVSVYDASGGFLFTVGTYGKTTNTLRAPTVVAAAPNGTAVYVYDSSEREIKVFALDHERKSATHRLTFGGKGDEPLKFREVVAMAADRRGALIVADTSRHDLQAIDASAGQPRSLWVRPMVELGMRDVATIAAGPESMWLMVADEKQLWVRW